MIKEEIIKEIRNYFELNNIKIHEIQFKHYLKVIALQAYIRKEERLKINEVKSINFRKLDKEQKNKPKEKKKETK